MKSSEKKPPPKGRGASPAGAAAPAEPGIQSGASADMLAQVEFRLLAEQSLVGIAIHTKEGCLYANGRMAEIFGYSREELVRTAPDALVAENDRLRIAALLSERRKSGFQTAHYACQGRRKDGSAVEVESYGYMVEIGGKPAAITITVDITERKRHEEELRQSRKMLQLILDAIPSAVFWKDRECVYLGANRVFLQAVGLKSPEEVLGKSDYVLPWASEQADSYRQYDQRVMKTGLPEYGIIESCRLADGTNAWLRTNKVPLRDPEGNIIGILGTYEDITERKRAEEQVDRQLDELRRWQQATLGREDRIRELKAEVNALCGRLGEAPRYASAEPAPDAPRPPG